FGTHIRARVIHADVGPFPIFPIRMVISAGAGRPAASWRAGRTFAFAIFAFFRYFSRLDQKNFSRFRRALSLISTIGFAIFTISSTATAAVALTDGRTITVGHDRRGRLSWRSHSKAGLRRARESEEVQHEQA